MSAGLRRQPREEDAVPNEAFEEQKAQVNRAPQRWGWLTPVSTQPAERQRDRAVSAADGSSGHHCAP